MKLRVKFINENDVLKVEKKPVQQYSGLPGCSIKDLLKVKSVGENEINLSSSLPPISEEDVCTESDVFFKPTALLENGNDNHVEEFDFKNFKKGMSEKLDSPFHIKRNLGYISESPKSPRTPRSKSGLGLKKKKNGEASPQTPKTPRTPHTPRTPRTPTATRNLYTTPKSNRAGTGTGTRLRRSARKVERTPAPVRASLNRRIKKLAFEDEGETDEDTEEEEEDEEEDDSDADKDYEPSMNSQDSESEDEEGENCGGGFEWKKESSKVGFAHSATSKFFPRSGRRRQLIDEDMEASTNDYFERNAEGSSCVTSDHTLSRLQKPRLGSDTLKSLLQGIHKSHEKEREDLLEEYISLFPHWFTLLSEGFSLFLVGVGSKKELLSLFQERMLQDEDHVVINGFFPSLTIRSILCTIVEEVMEIESHPQGLLEQMRLIANHYSDPDAEPLFILINNLDGPMLRSEKTQFFLSQLASFKRVRLLASLDHINSPLIFDGKRRSLYNPLWWDATTLSPYVEETSYENSLLVQQSGELALSSLIHVFKSLTPNAKGIFMILAKHQLNQKDNSSYAGFSFVDLYQRCREAFLVNSDLTLRAQLTEFIDHKLLKTKKSYDGTENLIIPLKSSVLEEFIEQNDD